MIEAYRRAQEAAVAKAESKEQAAGDDNDGDAYDPS